MNPLEALRIAWHHAIDTLDYARHMSVIDICRTGIQTEIAKDIHTLADIYFGPTRATRRQAECVTLARDNRHSLDTLGLIETLVKKLRDKDKTWKMRQELCALPPDTRRLRARAKELLLDFNGPEQITNTPAVKARALSNSTYARLMIDAPGHQIKAVLDNLHKTDDPAAAAIELLHGHDPGSPGGSGGGQAITPAVIISLPDAVTIEEGTGDDVLLSLTNGTRMTGRDYTQARLTDAGLTMLVHPVTGPVNLYDTQRLPNTKQRMIAKLENPVCTAEGCGVGADSCQIHHIIAWKHGGHTDILNLCCLCKFHNGRNDDDRDQPRYGHVERIGGQIHHVPAFGGPPVLNDHPVARGGAMRVA